MTKAKKVGEITVNGRQVSMFTPPHDEPDFMWVDMQELARCFMSANEARKAVEMARQFGGDQRTYDMAANGDRLVVIVPHAMAQGFCGARDASEGWTAEDENGPHTNAYCIAAGVFNADHGPKLSFEQIVSAFHNQGGPFLRGI